MGRVRLHPRSMRRPGCALTAYPLVECVGFHRFLSPWATRLACPAAASWSFDVASDRLDEIAGLRDDDGMIRRHAHRAADGSVARPDGSPPAAAFGRADCDVEFLTDGVMASSRDRWREVRIARFQRRPPGEPAEWSARQLPAPTVSVAYASLANCDRFESTWRPRAEGLGIDPDTVMLGPADEDGWIWRAVGERFGSADGVLDIFHTSQHIAAANALHGEEKPGAAARMDGYRGRRLTDGCPGLLDHVGRMLEDVMTAAGRAAVAEVIG